MIDLLYVFWSHSLKYTFSADLLVPINEAFSGVLEKLTKRLKLGPKVKEIENTNKDKTDKVIPIIANPPFVNEGDKNEFELEFKRQVSGKKNKDYDSIQIDFDQNNNIYNNKNHSFDFKNPNRLNM